MHQTGIDEILYQPWLTLKEAKEKVEALLDLTEKFEPLGMTLGKRG